MQDRRAGNPERRSCRAAVPLALRAVCVARPVRLSPLLRPQFPSPEMLQRLLRQKGGVHSALLAEAEAAARPPASRRTRVLSSRRLEPAEQKAGAR